MPEVTTEGCISENLPPPQLGLFWSSIPKKLSEIARTRKLHLLLLLHMTTDITNGNYDVVRSSEESAMFNLCYTYRSQYIKSPPTLARLQLDYCTVNPVKSYHASAFKVLSCTHQCDRQPHHRLFFHIYVGKFDNLDGYDVRRQSWQCYICADIV